jgi:hypothetical protein
MSAIGWFGLGARAVPLAALHRVRRWGRPNTILSLMPSLQRGYASPLAFIWAR